MKSDQTSSFFHARSGHRLVSPYARQRLSFLKDKHGLAVSQLNTYVLGLPRGHLLLRWSNACSLRVQIIQLLESLLLGSIERRLLAEESSQTRFVLMLQIVSERLSITVNQACELAAQPWTKQFQFPDLCFKAVGLPRGIPILNNRLQRDACMERHFVGSRVDLHRGMDGGIEFLPALLKRPGLCEQIPAREMHKLQSPPLFNIQGPLKGSMESIQESDLPILALRQLREHGPQAGRAILKLEKTIEK